LERADKAVRAPWVAAAPFVPFLRLKTFSHAPGPV
jgi:hypothetical protein